MSNSMCTLNKKSPALIIFQGITEKMRISEKSFEKVQHFVLLMCNISEDMRVLWIQIWGLTIPSIWLTGF